MDASNEDQLRNVANSLLDFELPSLALNCSLSEYMVIYNQSMKTSFLDNIIFFVLELYSTLLCFISCLYTSQQHWSSLVYLFTMTFQGLINQL